MTRPQLEKDPRSRGLLCAKWCILGYFYPFLCMVILMQHCKIYYYIIVTNIQFNNPQKTVIWANSWVPSDQFFICG